VQNASVVSQDMPLPTLGHHFDPAIAIQIFEKKAI
jgi:hypothetical protein